MKTLTPTPPEMEQRIARFRQLKPKSRRYAEQSGIPAEAFEMIAAKNIFLLMAPGGAGGANAAPAVEGAPGLTVNVCHCPPGNGPMLHAHQRTRETFFCLRGRFEVRWGDQGEHRTTLEEFDMIAVPPNVSRAFTNVTEQDAYLLVMIQGGNDDLNDVSYSPEVAQQITQRFGPQVKERFETVLGWNFEAGV
ncbi:MAG TPA: cupin domain-containing protein [Ramlibacter sp.]|nr:cupin domain-containing protein [Ramlibacter sp.]